MTALSLSRRTLLSSGIGFAVAAPALLVGSVHNRFVWVSLGLS